jgi:Fur family iron response transcriptional regulator
MPNERPFADALNRLRGADLRPTRQRLALCKMLFEHGDRHLTAEVLHAEAQGADIKVSLATVYNTLHQFTDAGLLREVIVDGGKTYFDTNTADHHHFYLEDECRLQDICGDGVAINGLPSAPDGTEVASIDVIVRVRKAH